MDITGKYFGTDGFRGRAGIDVTGVHAYRIGRFLGWYFGARLEKKCRAVIGKDTRLSSYMLEYSLCAGLTASGADAYIMHVTTTPSVAYVARSENFDVGIMVSASHNPYYDNGIKLTDCRGGKLDDGVLALVERYIDGDFSVCGGRDIPFACGKEIGKTVDFVAGRNRYAGRLISLATRPYGDLKIGLDGANGSAWELARTVFSALGAKTVQIGAEPDGLNVNDGVGSTHISALRALVLENPLDIGFAFDGDADRCLAVDEKGGVISGDGELYIIAKFLAARGELQGGGVVCTQMSNFGLIESLKKCGIYCEICDVGDKNVARRLAEKRLSLGGERSGHIIIPKFSGTGDGMITAITLTEALLYYGCKASELLKGFRELPSSSFSLPSDAPELLAKQLRPIADGFKNIRSVVRASGTEPVVRVMLEGENAHIYARLLKEAAQKYCRGGD